jgi:hypothetical protein
LKVKELDAIEYHKYIAYRQRNAYNTQKSDTEFLKDKLLIDYDYKQKIILGKGSRIPNSEFFQGNRKKLYCLGFGVYFVEERIIENETEKFVNCLSVDFIGDYEVKKVKKDQKGKKNQGDKKGKKRKEEEDEDDDQKTQKGNTSSKDLIRSF